MAIVNSKSGRYIKVIREMSVFRPNSVQVFYYSFSSRKDKEEYFSRRRSVDDFVFRVRKYVEESNKKFEDELSEFLRGKDVSKFSSIDDLPKKFRDRVYELSELSNYSFDVLRGWDKLVPLNAFKDVYLVHSLGFDDSWLIPLQPWDIQSVSTGAFTNQNFTFECLYGELKKIFKDDYIDC